MSDESKRAEVVAKYRAWLNQKIKDKDIAVIAELKRLKQLALKGDLSLGCWCAPRACHGDVIKEFIERSISRDVRKQKELSK